MFGMGDGKVVSNGSTDSPVRSSGDRLARSSLGGTVMRSSIGTSATSGNANLAILTPSSPRVGASGRIGLGEGGALSAVVMSVANDTDEGIDAGLESEATGGAGGEELPGGVVGAVASELVDSAAMGALGGVAGAAVSGLTGSAAAGMSVRATAPLQLEQQQRGLSGRTVTV